MENYFQPLPAEPLGGIKPKTDFLSSSAAPSTHIRRLAACFAGLCQLASIFLTRLRRIDHSIQKRLGRQGDDGRA